MGTPRHEIADRAPHCYTQVRWNEFVDLRGVEEDLSGLGPGPPVAAGMAPYIIVEGLAALLDELDDDDDDDTDVPDTSG